MGPDSEQQRYLQSLQRRVRSGRRRTWWLVGGIAAAVLVGLSAWFAYYYSTVLSYARLNPAIRMERSGADADRVVLSYQPLSGGKIGFRHAEGDRETELLDDEPSANVDREQRFEWRWRGLKTGDRLKVTYRQGWSLVTEELSVPNAAPAPPLGDAVLTGEVTDATNNKPVAGADIQLIGTRLAARTDAEGRFRLPGAPAGAAGVEISADKYSTEQVDMNLVSKQETPLRCVLSPGLKQGQIRLVLTWGPEPKDLDAHLEGPLRKGERFHISFQNKGDLKSREFVSLDVDAKNGFGPETITVLGVLPGTYHYFVHDYTNRDTAHNSALSRSGAEVKVYQGGQAYRFRANNESLGTVWNVCDIVVNASGATIKKTDRYEHRTIAAAADLVFLLDVAPGTKEYIESRTAECLKEAERHQAGGLNCNFALVPFGEPAEKYGLAQIPLTGDLQDFERQLAATTDPQPLPKDCVAAIEAALEFNFRPGATVQFVLLASSPCAEKERIADIAQTTKKRNVSTTVYAQEAERETYLPLCAPGGKFIPIREDVAESEANYTDGNAVARDSNAALDVKEGKLGGGMKVTGIYSIRTQHTLENVITLGGTKESEDSVDEGLAWLARHQAKDGHWGPDCLAGGANSCCEKGRGCSDGGAPYEMAQTGLAILAFQAGGHYYFNKHKYSDVVRRGLDWLVTCQGTEGELVGSQNFHSKIPGASKNSAKPRTPFPGGAVPRGLPFGFVNANQPYQMHFMYEHGIAAFALTEACAVARASKQEPQEAYLRAAKHAVAFIEDQQHDDGGWRYTTSRAEACDASVTGWQVLALKTARAADIPVQKKTLAGVGQFFSRIADFDTGRSGYMNRGDLRNTVGSGETDAMTAVGMLVQELLFKNHDSPLVKKGAPYLASVARQIWGNNRGDGADAANPGLRTVQIWANNNWGDAAAANYYFWYNGTLAMYHAGGEPWEQWNKIVRDKVRKLQVHDGCTRGSWPISTEFGGSAGGRIYTTALAVLTLEVYYRFAREEKGATDNKTGNAADTETAGPEGTNAEEKERQRDE